MADVSPTKWHRGHTTWFFETFLLEPTLTGYDAFDPDFRYLFNSYYEAVGPRHPRSQRGLLSRPTVEEVARYRAHVDAAMEKLIDRCDADAWPDVRRRSSCSACITSSNTKSCCSWTSSTCSSTIRSTRVYVDAPLAVGPARPADADARLTRAASSRSGTRRTAGGRLRVRQRVAAPQGVPRAVPHRRPARDRRRVARVHGRRRLRAGRSSGSPTVGTPCRSTAGTRRCTGATTSATAGRPSRSAAGARSSRANRSCT